MNGQMKFDAKDNEVQALASRVAGHCLFTSSKAGVAIERSTGFILKLVSSDVRGEREKQFYSSLFDSNQKDGDGPAQFDGLSEECKSKLRHFVPQFYGLITINDRTFLRLEDRSLGGDNVMDIKMGEITWDRNASEEKIANEIKKRVFEGQKFRILGFRAKNTATNNELVIKDKKQVKHLVDCCPMLELFLDKSSELRNVFLEQLRTVQLFFQTQRELEFISSSILLAWRIADRRVTVTMIDFAHVFKIDQIDRNYLDALDELISVLDNLKLN